MKSSFLAALLAFFTAGMLLAFEARAEPSSADASQTKEKARVHFERGVTLAREGKLEAAVEEFEGAYRLSPHYSVLFNLAQARAAMGQSVEAVDAFRRYLDEGGNAIDAARRASVTELIAFHEKRIGSVRLEIEPEGAEVWLDGRLLGKSPLSEPVRLVEGSHTVTVRKSGFVALASAVKITAGSTSELVLRAATASAFTPATQGILIVRCAVPDVAVSIDGNELGSTTSQKLFRIPDGQRTLLLTRTGYAADERTVKIPPDEATEIACRLRQDGKGPLGQLRVRPNPIDAAVWVNGQRYRGERLPHGRHNVRIERRGYHAWTSLVRVEPSKTAELDVNLEPTKEQKDAWQAEKADRTLWALATTIGGTLLVGSAVATYVWNSGRYGDWLDDRRALDAQLTQGPATAAMLEENAALNRRSLSIERADVAAVGIGLAGAVTLGVSGALWVGVVE